jgi:poly(hydroxyalkanoate) depolymerase family esterase
LAAIKEGRLKTGLGPLPGMNLPGLDLTGLVRANPPPVPEGAQFVARSFACAAGARDYKLYIPASAPAQPRGLVVMLHGCKQNPDDFACGTNMNMVAETHGMLVAYPAQPGTANVSSCWNWFNPSDQQRNAGEPSIIAGITRQIMAEFHLDRHQVFIAGLSAGGAMAAIMGETYPDLYAAVGIHSGLAYGSADDVIGAFAAMRGEGVSKPAARVRQPARTPPVRTIVFHGSADTVVHPSNADEIVAAARLKRGGCDAKRDRVQTADGWAATRTIVVDDSGTEVVEYWLVDGAAHSWCGGDPTGSYTDSRGPDASSEMVRFFLAQRARA